MSQIEIFSRSIISNEKYEAGGGLFGNPDAVGYQVVTPFVLDGSEGEAILINRGWIPRRNLNPATRPQGQVQYSCNRWQVWLKGTTSVPKSVPHLVVDKVRQALVSEVLNSNVFLCSGLLQRYLIDGMDVTILTTHFRPTFIVTLVWNTKKLVTFIPKPDAQNPDFLVSRFWMVFRVTWLGRQFAWLSSY